MSILSWTCKGFLTITRPLVYTFDMKEDCNFCHKIEGKKEERKEVYSCVSRPKEHRR